MGTPPASTTVALVSPPLNGSWPWYSVSAYAMSPPSPEVDGGGAAGVTRTKKRRAWAGSGSLRAPSRLVAEAVDQIFDLELLVRRDVFELLGVDERFPGLVVEVHLGLAGPSRGGEREVLLGRLPDVARCRAALVEELLVEPLHECQRMEG